MPIEFSDEVLEETPERVTKFLSGIGADPVIRTLLVGVNMTDAAIEEGRTLLLACLAAPAPAKANPQSESSKAHDQATASLSVWDEAHFPRTRAALTRFYPDAADYFQRNGALDPRADTAGSITAITSFCACYRHLDNGDDPERVQSKDADKAAINILHERGITRDVVSTLEAQLKIALGPTAPLAPLASQQARRDKLVALKLWFDDWAESARTVLKKRGHLIRVGLAKRRTPRKPEPPAEKK